MTAKRVVADPTDIGTAAQPPFIRLPDIATLFDRRAERLEALADGNALGDYLRFTARLIRAQAAASRSLPAGTLPSAADIAFCHENKLPLVDRLTWRRDPSWLAALDTILEALTPVPMPPAARAALDGLGRMDAAGREGLADQVLGIDAALPEPAMACFVSAALQVYWSRMAALLDAAAVKQTELARGLPCLRLAARRQRRLFRGHVAGRAFPVLPPLRQPVVLRAHQMRQLHFDQGHRLSACGRAVAGDQGGDLR